MEDQIFYVQEIDVDVASRTPNIKYLILHFLADSPILPFKNRVDLTAHTNVACENMVPHNIMTTVYVPAILSLALVSFF
jgi:hypothetical protein